MYLPNITILDEKDKRLHQRSEEVTFPLDDEMIKTINDSLDYLEMSQNEELAKKYDLRAGMGLSMCQIGIMKRIFVVSEDNGDGTFDCKDEWLWEYFAETDYSELTKEDFEKSVKSFVMNQLKQLKIDKLSSSNIECNET